MTLLSNVKDELVMVLDRRMSTAWFMICAVHERTLSSASDQEDVDATMATIVSRLFPTDGSYFARTVLVVEQRSDVNTGVCR